MTSTREAIRATLSASLERLRAVLEPFAASGISKMAYTQYLSDQAFMVRDVCPQMLAVASSPELAGRNSLRRFLIELALEEEAHHEIARTDLQSLDVEVRPPSLDARLWHLYSSALATSKPFQRLGVSVVLENSGAVVGSVVRTILAESPFLNAGNTKFVRAHLHDDIPHGEQLLRALDDGELDNSEIRTLETGIEDAGTMLARLLQSDLSRSI